MRVLLDTHTLLWALREPGRLSTRAADLIRAPENVVLVSAASAWEIATKHRLGRLPSTGPIIAGYASHLSTLRAEDLPVRSEHALKAASLSAEHRDPFDRMLAAQAILEGVPLLTDDAAFSKFQDLVTLW